MDASRRRELQAQAEQLLQQARDSRNSGDWLAVYGHLANGVATAAAARDPALLDSFLLEIEAIQGDGLPGSGFRGLEALRREAEAHRQRALLAAARTPEVDRLDQRLHNLLLLLVVRDPDVETGQVALSGLARVDADGDVHVDLGQRFRHEYAPLLVDGYDAGYATFGLVGGPSLAEVQPQIDRALRAVAAELVAAGAQVRGLARDAVPMVAYALLHGRIPVGADAAESPVSVDRVNDALLRIADAVAAMSARTRPIFIDLYRLSLVLGTAQKYAETLSLTSLPIT